MEQILLILFCVLLVGFGVAKKKNAAGKTTEPKPRPRIPIEDFFPSAKNTEYMEAMEENDLHDTVSVSIRQDEPPEYKFAGMEASQEEAGAADTFPSAFSETGEKVENPSEVPQGEVEFSLRNAVINQMILERKYS